MYFLNYCIISREEIFAKSEFEIFSREDIFANMLFTRKYLPVKISCREIFFPRIFSVPKICRVVGLCYPVYSSITESPLPISRLCATIGPSRFWITHCCHLSYSLRYGTFLCNRPYKINCRCLSQFQNGHYC